MPIMAKVLNALLIVMAFAFLTVSKPADAASTIADTPCDSLYYESLSARAWLEAQREISQNQNFILKPDSVFEYTCFDLFLHELADHARNMLSETMQFGDPLGATSMDNALQNLVISSLTNYINTNFNAANLLAGHSAMLGIATGAPPGAIDHTPQALGSPQAYSCNIMRGVWHAAKCMNFISYPQYDGFFTFQEYTTSADPRHLPTALACTPVNLQYGTNLTAALTTGPWSNDPVQTYLGMTGPEPFGGGAPAGTCTGDCPCTGAPIPTGITVTSMNGQNGESGTYEEHVCLQAGCRYHPGQITTITGSLVSVYLYGTTVQNTPGCYAR